MIFREEKKQKIIGWTSLFAAVVFLCNPDTGIIDILPDFIGYMLLCTAISKIADIDDRISEAYNLFKRMVYISAAKFAALFLQFGFIPTTDQSVSMLLLSFVYSVAELMVVIPALLKLYEGVLTVHCLGIALDRGGRGSKQEHCVVLRATPSCDISRVILWRCVGFIGGLVLLVNNDESEIFNGREDRRASAYDEVSLSVSYSYKRIISLSCRKSRMDEGDPVAVARVEDLKRLRC